MHMVTAQLCRGTAVLEATRTVKAKNCKEMRIGTRSIRPTYYDPQVNYRK
jgi:hypothetical protein